MYDGKTRWSKSVLLDTISNFTQDMDGGSNTMACIFKFCTHFTCIYQFKSQDIFIGILNHILWTKRLHTDKSFSEAHNICRACCVPKLFWMSKQNKNNNLCTTHVLQVFWAYNFHEQSVVILWVSWCKNMSFRQRFTCNYWTKFWNSCYSADVCVC